MIELTHQYHAKPYVVVSVCGIVVVTVRGTTVRCVVVPGPATQNARRTLIVDLSP